MKGHLDAEQLKNMKRDELQALAKNMGVSAGGKNEDIIARIAAAAVGIPGEGKATTEKAEEAAAPKQKARKEVTEAVAGLVKVKAITRFLDKQFNQIKDAGEAYSVSRERAAELAAAGVADIIE